MKPNAIYSKSGKGVQEASGKTSLLKRADRAVLSAIDGRATLGEVAQKVGKSFDAEFEKLISQLDKDGFVREVTAGAASSSASQSRPVVPTVKQPAAKAPAAKATAPARGADDLDFTTIMPAIKRAPAAAPPRPAAPDAAVQQRAKEQEAALYKARQEAEARAQAERDRLRQETEAKARAEAEAKIRAETEKKLREEASMRLKAEAEAKARAKLEAERRIREEIERKAKEEAEKARREAEELRERLEAERKAREAEEEERRVREEMERQRREAEERQRREEEDRRLREKEEAARRAREEEEARVRQALEMEEARGRARQREREQETKKRQPTLPDAPRPAAESARADGGSLDALMADLDSFSQREDEERQAREAAERQAREEKKRKAHEEAERRAREQAAQAERERERAAEEARRREEEERRAQEEAEQRVREAEEARRLQAEERQRRAREALAARAQARPAAAADPAEDIGVTAADLGMDDVRRDEAAVTKDARKAQRERERETRQREREARERAQAAQREERVKYPKARRPVKWGRPLAILLFGLLVVALGALHIVPLPMAEYEDLASQALGRPVKIGSGRLWLFTGLRLDLEDVTVGGNVRIASAHAYPHIGSLIDEKKSFGRIELDRVTVAQQAIGSVVTAKLRGGNFSVSRLLVTNLKLEGPVPLPLFEADAAIAPDGAVRSVTLRGPESLNARLTPAANGEVELDVTAASLAVPFVPELTLASFAMKGTANRLGMNITSWGGALLDGVVSGTANVRWTGNWHVDGAVTMRGINAAIFAPALLSEGKAEGSGRFSMSGADPAKLHNGARLEGSFTMGKGVLGTFDLARVLHTSGRQYGGRTQFSEMSGQAIYDRGAVALRNVSISAGALNAGVSADIAPGGALAGRIVADIRTSVQPLRVVLVLGGTVKEPQVRN